MTQKKLIARLKSYIGLDKRRRKKKAEELEKIINQIKKKEKELVTQYRKLDKGKERTRLKRHIKTLHAQRKKGMKALSKTLED